MLQLQSIRRTAEPAINVIPIGASEEGLATRPGASFSRSDPSAAARFHDQERLGSTILRNFRADSRTVQSLSDCS